MNKYRQLERQQWQEVMHLVQKCEAKYGSISETPEKDQMFVKIKKLCANNKAAGLSIDKQEKMVEAIEAGHTRTYIAKRFHVTGSTVKKVRIAYDLKPKPVWKYIQFKDGKPIYFIKSKRRDLTAIFKRNFYNKKVTESFLLNNGYKLKVCNTIWQNIPIGTYYVTPDHKKCIQKIDDKYRE
ncbi:hypothetical protein [uncultured Lactobacillus sp.]|uniref:hypothetical protein n=1 Tax=uncultured Lactobacillus sp. TaxID=153152 RepID=UPI0026384AD7|nr:hypothetical protein [uncultured Lactobacillus sp.]